MWQPIAEASLVLEDRMLGVCELTSKHIGDKRFDKNTVKNLVQ